MNTQRLRRTPAGARESVQDLAAVGARATSLGALGVTIASVLYALSPAAAALPAQPFDAAAAAAGALAGGAMMGAAGMVGIFSDLVLAIGAFLLALDAARRDRGIAAAGWSAIFISVLIFIFVDTLVGQVLVPLARAQDAAGTFAGFKRLFDGLFLLGTAAFGLGACLAMSAELTNPVRRLSRPLALAAAATGLASIAAAAGCYLHLPMHLLVGGSILFGAALFTVIGAQFARASGSAQPPPASGKLGLEAAVPAPALPGR